jgi:hypothetical protein
LPVYWSAGLAAAKLKHVGRIRDRIPHTPIAARQAVLLSYLELCAVRLIPWQRYKRYVTDCPACGRAAPVLLAKRLRDPPFCRRCWPSRWPAIVTLLAALNAHHQLAPLPVSPHLLRCLLTKVATLPPSLSALLPLLSPALAPPARRVGHACVRPELRYNFAAGWKRTPGMPSVVNYDLLALVARGLHPVQFFLGVDATVVQGVAATHGVGVRARGRHAATAA